MSSLTKVLRRKFKENNREKRSSCQDDADKSSDTSSDAACGIAQ